MGGGADVGQTAGAGAFAADLGNILEMVRNNFRLFQLLSVCGRIIMIMKSSIE